MEGNSNISIRPVRLGDEGTLGFIQTESWKVAFKGILSDEDLERCTDRNKATEMYRRTIEDGLGHGYILEYDGEPQCIAYWDKSREADLPDYAELICIHSLQKRWRSGCGSRMLERVLADIEAAGYRKTMLWVFEKNERARAFYEYMGFHKTERTKEYRGAIEVMYLRDLDE